MNLIGINQILQLIDQDYEVVNSKLDYKFSKIKSLLEAEPGSLSWVVGSIKNPQQRIMTSKAKILIIDKKIKLQNADRIDKVIIKVSYPKKLIIDLINTYFSKTISYGIHPTSIIHPEAKIHSQSYIGPNCYIGKCEIDSETIIDGNVYIYDNVFINKRCRIYAGVVLGGDGFNYYKNKNNEYEKFPHIGSVVIKDDVDIGSNSFISPGGLGKTYINTGTKIAQQVYIGANVIIGKSCSIRPNVMISGSVTIGHNVIIAPSVTIRDGKKIGSDSTLGMGAVIVKDVPEKTTVFGNPARTA